ncbi:MAG: glycosyltransferase family 8 protein [Clostridia bacterium]|nr:glycosyltransferase family 8 protein [Clostridia bacterium]
MNKQVIPVFYAINDGYVPFLAVSLESLVAKISEQNFYEIRVLYTHLNEEHQKALKKYERKNLTIEFVDLNEKIERIANKLYTRDYFSMETYYRLFLPDLYPEMKKALYIDADTVLLDDIAKLYNIDLGTNLVGAIPDGAVQSIKEFQDYVELVVGLKDYHNYFNAGILLMNLEELRNYRFQVKFMYLLDTIKFRVAQDQDYLNRLCKGRVTIIGNEWNTMPGANPDKRSKNPKLIHFNLSNKPWHLDNVPYEEYFWDFAWQTDFYDEIRYIKDHYTEAQRQEDVETGIRLISLCAKEADCIGDDRK